MGFLGYRRSDGRVGVRNHVVVLPSVSCANGVVQGIGREVPGVKILTHTEGCGRGPRDFPMALRTLVGVARHPNVSAALVVGLGCEGLKAEFIAGGAGENAGRVEFIGIQEEGGTPNSIRRGTEIVREMLDEAGNQSREEAGFHELTLAMECGGSDAFSGLTANPCVGTVADWLIGEGGTVILSEITEFLGTEDILAGRCATPEVRGRLLGLLGEHRRYVKQELGPLANMVIAPGNMDGGLSSISEKSLGCIRKGGTSPIRQVVDYAEVPTEKGLVIMDTPGSDIFSMTGKISGGAQVLLFTTGRGSPAGSPIAPVVKIATNSKLFEHMPDDMDFDAGEVIAGRSIAEVGADLRDYVIGVANGAPTKPELTLTELFAINTVSEPF
ncbi:MAG: Altronate dehydratase [Acidimicrobiales bacterium]|nr:Altronate dehydratase [Acidimicrobiales bacterium]